MQNFTERHHAFISAMYYKLLKEAGFENYRDTFVKATSTYAMQRGHRMALRALRDGRPLNFASYRYYGEWAYTPESMAEMEAMGRAATEMTVENDNLHMKIHYCPWSNQYIDMGLTDGAIAYCEDLDVAIARGFNPRLTYTVDKVMHEKRDYCLQCQMCASMGAESEYGPKDPANIKGFDYHCGHVYKTFCQLIASVYGTKGVMINAKVIEAFAEEYGEEMAKVVLSYKDTDFTTIDM